MILFLLYILKKYHGTYQEQFISFRFFRKIYVKNYYCKIFVIFFILFFFHESTFALLSTFAVCRIHQHHSLLFYPRSFYSFSVHFRSFCDSHLCRDKYEIIHTSRIILFEGIPRRTSVSNLYSRHPSFL